LDSLIIQINRCISSISELKSNDLIHAFRIHILMVIIEPWMSWVIFYITQALKNFG